MTTLTGPRLRLRPLTADDAPLLVAAASDGELWRSPFTVIPSADTVAAYLDKALSGLAQGHMLPFAIEAQASGQVIGSTRFWKIDHANRKLEIGGSWLGLQWQGGFANPEAKWLMLSHAFDQLRCVRVQFTTDVLNERSRAAILKLGAVEEGIIRHERIMPDGRLRDSLRFSILDHEWPAARDRLLTRLARFD